MKQKKWYVIADRNITKATRVLGCSVCGKPAKYVDSYYGGSVNIRRCAKHHDKSLKRRK